MLGRTRKVRFSFKEATHYKRNHVYEIYDHNLKNRLDILLNSSLPTFNHDFDAFRQELSRAKSIPLIPFDKLVQSLLDYSSDTSEKTIPPSSPPSSPQTETLLQYLHQCLKRIKHPLPEHLQSKVSTLLEQYDDKHNHAELLRKHYKFLFLITLVNTIKTHPEKNYAECYELTKKNTPIATQGLQTTQTCLSFFAKNHRFNDFINELLNPDLNNPSHDDADRFSC